MYVLRKTIQNHYQNFFFLWSRTPSKMAEGYNTDSISGREVHVNDTSTHRQGNTENEIVGYLKVFIFVALS